jgi:hypothetical protein
MPLFSKAPGKHTQHSRRYHRVDRRTRVGQKSVALTADYTAKLMASGRTIDAELQSLIHRAADLVAISEEHRLRWMRGDKVYLDRTMQLERMAARAVRDLYLDGLPTAKPEVEAEEVDSLHDIIGSAA